MFCCFAGAIHVTENLSTPLPKVPFLPLVHPCLTGGTALESKTNPGLPCSLIPLVAWPPSSSSLIMAGAWDLGSSKVWAVMCGVVVGSPPTWYTAYCKSSRSAALHRINCWRPWLACCSTGFHAVLLLVLLLLHPQSVLLTDVHISTACSELYLHSVLSPHIRRSSISCVHQA